MKILNLVDLDKSDIKYKIQKFPDGQQNIVIDKKYQFWGGFNSVERNLDEYPESIQIKSRLNNWKDLELITCTVASLRELGVEEIHLYTPYIMGARSDRKFEEGGNNYLKDVICPAINSLGFKSVTCIDPHSDVLEACIKGFRKESNLDLIKWVFMNYPQNTKTMEDFILVSPDAGASKKIYKLAEQIGYKGDIITCSKERDNNGNLTKTVVPINTGYENKDFIILDDIIDGGQTFINISNAIKDYYGDTRKGKIYLIITHGIFSKGFEELFKYFDGIYCTNSYNTISNIKTQLIEDQCELNIDLEDNKEINLTQLVKILDVF